MIIIVIMIMCWLPARLKLLSSVWDQSTIVLALSKAVFDYVESSDSAHAGVNLWVH